MLNYAILIMTLVCSTCFGTQYIIVDKEGANDMFLKMQKDKVDVKEVRNLDNNSNGYLLIVFEFPNHS